MTEYRDVCYEVESNLKELCDLAEDTTKKLMTGHVPIAMAPTTQSIMSDLRSATNRLMDLKIKVSRWARMMEKLNAKS